MPYGSHHLFLLFNVSNSVSKLLESDNWEIISKSETQTKFKFYFKSGRSGDDETAMFELLHSVPSEVTLEHINIDWENSNY